MNKTIIAVHGRASEGKSSTIKEVFRQIIEDFPHTRVDRKVNFKGDILVIITINNIKIGIESQGDPNSRMINEDTLRKLTEEKCQIILCATRTSGKTVKKVDTIANEFNYHTIWLSSYWSPSLNHNVLNKKAAANIIELIKSLMINQI
ncbi:MAG: hypothetical protein ACJ04Q_05010 [Flavobacteriales bacterium]